MMYSTHLPNLKSVASSVPEILKEFKICRQTDTCRYSAPFPTSKHDLPRPFRGVAGKNHEPFNILLASTRYVGLLSLAYSSFSLTPFLARYRSLSL